MDKAWRANEAHALGGLGRTLGAPLLRTREEICVVFGIDTCVPICGLRGCVCAYLWLSAATIGRYAATRGMCVRVLARVSAFHRDLVPAYNVWKWAKQRSDTESRCSHFFARNPESNLKTESC